MASAYSLDEEKELLLSRSQDLQWVDDVTDFQCVRCDKVLIRHYIANCGHKFCLNCKKLVGDGSKRWRCPLKECNKFIEDIHLQDVFFEETVFELRTHCPNHKYGCPIIGPLKDIGGHLRKCVDTRENALPVLLDQSQSLDSAFVIKQMKKMNEKMDSFGSTLNDMQKATEGKELAQERKWTEYDRNWADDKEMVNSVVRSFKEEKKKREEVTSNVDKNSSQLATLNAKVESLGKDLREDLQNQVFKPMSKFNERLETMSLSLNEMRKSMEETRKEKLEMGQTMSQLSAEVSALKEKLNETEEVIAQQAFKNVITPELQHLRRVSEYYKEKADFTWIQSDANSLLNGSNIELESKVFPLTGYPFAAQAKIELNSDLVWFHLCFKPLNISNAKGEIGVKVNPRIYFTVKDQSKGKERKDRITTTTFSYYNKFEFNRYYSIGDYVAKNLVNCPLYLVDDKWVIDIHVEAPEVAQSVYSHNGTLTWAIDDFRKKQQMEVDGLMEYHVSPYFYTSAKGERVQVQAYLNGRGDYKNKGVSIWVDFLNGVYDENLKGSVYRKTTVTIFHPTQPHTNISKSQENNYIFSNLFHMGSETEIESLLHNDTLYYKVTVEAIKR